MYSHKILLLLFYCAVDNIVLKTGRNDHFYEEEKTRVQSKFLCLTCQSSKKPLPFFVKIKIFINHRGKKKEKVLLKYCRPQRLVIILVN